ncbi:MAG: sugar phosphate nucleotidyltransferase [Candidatus Marinimicrobia bacterium]|nr:sugar phosphate nucleotidyltransferase [Candidatus Neomarinimicrobiota bacterium]
MKLVIIAAGLGSRLSSVSNNTPKLLVPVMGQPLINKLLSNCIDAGIKNIVVVTGFNNHIIEDHLKRLQTPIQIEVAYNPDWKLANGVSVLSAQKHIPAGEDFMISMSDHYYTSDILKIIKDESDNNTIASVGADYKIDEIHDIDDGMKLKIDEDSNLIRSMSKTLSKYNAIDCGIFKCKYEFFDYLKKAKEKDECSLSDACNLLMNKGLMGSVDIKSYPWIDIDTPEALDFINQNPKKFI